MRMGHTSIVRGLVLGLLAFEASFGVVMAADDRTWVTEAIVLGRSGSGRMGRSLVQPDPLIDAMIGGRFQPPRAGESVTSADGSSRAWSAMKAGEDGWFRGPRVMGGHTYISVKSDAERVVILEAAGHSAVWVNETPHAGDPYAYGYLKIPVKLRAGENALLIRNGRGQLRVGYTTPRSEIQVETGDATLPDLVVGAAAGDTWGAVVVMNATESVQSGLVLRTRIGDGPTVETALPSLIPLSSRKVGFRIHAAAPGDEGEIEAKVAVVRDGTTLDEASVTLRKRRPEQVRKETFVSSIDGSVQYYGLVPAAAREPSAARPPGLILTLHGASVEGIGQAAVYAPRAWAHVVAPTNRRPYGFDWEDWGRLDAIEVLDLVQKRLGTDPRLTWLTGHSMGGHGTWHVGVTFPDRFAAIAPSAGWVSMRSYAGARPVEGGSSVSELLSRATLPSDTLVLAPNLARLGVYVLHGSADDNVPVEQARQMRQSLAGFHPDFAYYERPGAGHWWGNECCDWPPLMEFLRRHELEPVERVKHVDFVTASPGVSARSYWATIEAQQKPFVLSEIHLSRDPAARRISGRTVNVRRLALDLAPLDSNGPVEIALDGQPLSVVRPAEADASVWLRHDGERWSAIERPSQGLKNPRRCGPFKEAFRNRFLLVYGTKGTAEENAWALAKARLDAERFWYQGNGSVDMVSDQAFRADAEPDRNVILYGNSDNNAAWSALLGASPVQVSRDQVRVGERNWKGEDLTCLFVRPRMGSETASVGVVAGTGLPGLRLTETLAYFTSGVAFPDVIVMNTRALSQGVEGLLGGGFFGEDWDIASGEFAWRD